MPAHRSNLSAFLAAILLLIAMLPASAQTPEASPAAADLPPGPLGEQIAWLLETLNADPASIVPEEVETHFAPEFLAEVPATQLAAIVVQLQALLGEVGIEPGSIATSLGDPPTEARLIVLGQTGMRFQVTVVVDPETTLITGLFFQAAAPIPMTPIASPASEAGVIDEAVSFESSQHTVFGSYLSPDTEAEPQSAALIISGSGPTDRDGNNPGLPSLNTNLNLAHTLAGNGVPSLRYDKLYSGETGAGPYGTELQAGFQLFLQEARDAAAFLASRAGLDASQLILVGHSEGALVALVLAQEMAEASTPPAALILAAPISIRYLDLLQDQVTRQFEAAAAAGQVSQEEVDAGIAELAAIVESLRTTGTLPASIEHPVLAGLFDPGATEFLVEADAFDPARIAAGLPAGLPVLVLNGEKDEQVFPEHVDQLMAGFAEAGNDRAVQVELPNANHLLKVVEGTPNAAVDYPNANLPFSPEAVAAIEDFLESLAPGG